MVGGWCREGMVRGGVGIGRRPERLRTQVGPSERYCVYVYGDVRAAIEEVVLVAQGQGQGCELCSMQCCGSPELVDRAVES